MTWAWQVGNSYIKNTLASHLILINSASLNDLLEPVEGQNWDMLQVSIQEILKASVMAGVDVVSSPLTSLLGTAKALCVSLPLLVPNGLYLPSPPLYCPQPSPNTQVIHWTASPCWCSTLNYMCASHVQEHMGQLAEVSFRHKVSGVIQRLLLLLRSAHCCHSAAQWYISHLWNSRKILHKVFYNFWVLI